MDLPRLSAADKPAADPPTTIASQQPQEDEASLSSWLGAPIMGDGVSTENDDTHVGVDHATNSRTKDAAVENGDGCHAHPTFDIVLKTIRRIETTIQYASRSAHTWGR